MLSHTSDDEHYLCHKLSCGNATFPEGSMLRHVNIEIKAGTIVEPFDQMDGTGVTREFSEVQSGLPMPASEAKRTN